MGVPEFNDTNFESEVLNSTGPVLVDFWAPWCGPCRAVAPVLEKVAAMYQGRVTVAKLNVDENPETSMTYGIRSIHTIALFVGGEAVDGVMGAVPAATFEKLLDKHLGTAAGAATAS